MGTPEGSIRKETINNLINANLQLFLFSSVYFSSLVSKCVAAFKIQIELIYFIKQQNSSV